MVFAEMFRQKAHQAGREEMNTAWREWNQRREEAYAEGKPFDEPTPDARDATNSPRT